MKQNLEALFLAWRDGRDVAALAELFDAAAPELIGLARHLSRSRDEAADLVQSTFLTAMERAASFDRDRAVLPWLAGVLAMHARKLRERRARNPVLEPVERASEHSPERELGEREFAAAVNRAVAELPANYAQLVRRHVVDGLPPRELARELGLNSATTRARLHRGLKMLRRALPAGFGGTAWAASRELAPVRSAVLARGAQLAGVPVAGAVGGFSLAWIAPLLLVLAGLGWLASQRPAQSGSAAAPLASVEGGAHLVERELASAPTPVSNEAASSVAEHSEPRRVEIAADSRDSSTREPRSRAAAAASIAGRLLWPDGAPASGVALTLRGAAAGGARTARQVGPTGVDGGFEFELDEPGPEPLALEANADGHAPLEWLFVPLAAGGKLELGVARFEVAGVVTVLLLDENGAPLRDGWSVRVEAEAANSGASSNWRQPFRASASFDEPWRAYVVANAPPGLLTVHARHRSGVSAKGSVTVRSREVVEFPLVYRGPDPARRVTVRLSGAQLTRRFPPAADKLSLRAPGSSPRPFTGSYSPAAASYSLDGVEPGVYEVVLEDDRYEPLTVSGVSPGDVVKLPARGAAALRVRIVDADDAELELDYSLAVACVLPGQSANAYELHAERDPRPEGGVFGGILPGVDLELSVRVVGGAPRSIFLPALAKGEVREVVHLHDASRAIRGRVVDAHDPRPLEGVLVELTRGALAGHAHDSARNVLTSAGQLPARERWTRTDRDGRFEFEALSSGVWTVRARWGEHLRADRVLELTAAQAVIELERPAHGELLGRLRVPRDVDLRAASLVVAPFAGGAHSTSFGEFGAGAGLEGDGRFRVGPLPLGACSLSLILPSNVTGAASMSSILPLGQFQVRAGEPEEVEIDLRSSYPASVSVRADIDGEPAARAYVAFVREGESTAGSELVVRSSEGGVPVGSSGVTLDSMGRGLHRGLQPGTVRAWLIERDGAWAWRCERATAIAAGAKAEVEIRTTTYELDVDLVDAANGQPLANFEFEIRTEGPRGEHVALRSTDAHGRVRLRLPAQTTRFAAPGASPSGVAWGPGQNPLVVRLSRAE
jgi:RNA polymerase sigma-70 factor (ECF subfamily)